MRKCLHGRWVGLCRHCQSSEERRVSCRSRPPTEGNGETAGPQAADRSVNDTLIKRNWLLGLRIQHEVLKDQRAEYGEQVIMKLAEELIDKYGRGFKKSNLYLFVSFYQNHPDFFQLPIGKSLDMADDDIFQSLTGKFPIRLSWTHYSIILQGKTADGRWLSMTYIIIKELHMEL